MSLSRQLFLETVPLKSVNQCTGAGICVPAPDTLCKFITKDSQIFYSKVKKKGFFSLKAFRWLFLSFWQAWAAQKPTGLATLYCSKLQKSICIGMLNGGYRYNTVTGMVFVYVGKALGFGIFFTSCQSQLKNFTNFMFVLVVCGPYIN
jgi:hypothetical protein